MKELRPPHDPIETIGEAYELLLEKTLEEAQKVKEKTGPALHKLIDKVKTSPKIETISGVTPPSDLAESLKRDLLDAARFCD